MAFLVVAGLAWPTLRALLDTGNREPPWLLRLEQLADPAPPPAELPDGMVVVLVDGLRLDEVRAMPSLSALEAEGIAAEVEIPPPTTSRPVYHSLFTGVAQATAGLMTNRHHGAARVDSLCDRLRAVEGGCAWYGMPRDWWFELFGAMGEPEGTLDEGRAGFERLWGEFESRGALLLVHLVDVDATAHHGGIATEAHRRALAEADDFVLELRHRVEGTPRTLVILSDHGHLEGGGHGGDEPEVSRVPMIVWRPGVTPARVQRRLAVEEVAPTLAALMGLPPPRSALAVAAEEVATAAVDSAAMVRARVEAMAQERARALERRRRARPGWLALWGLLSMMLLGSAKRSLGGFDRAILVAPLVWLTLVPTLHLWLLGRPLSRSASDAFLTHGLRLMGIGALAALAAIATGLLAGRIGRREPSAGGMGARRAAVAVGWTAITSFSGVIAWYGGSLSPYPGPLGAYAPILFAGSTAGACVFSALLLGSTVAIRDPSC